MKLALALTAVLSMAAVFPLLAQDDGAATAATIEAVRSGGTTLTAWVVERAPGGQKTFLEQAASQGAYDWAACPGITLAEARRLVGSAEAAKLRERDGWGHALEYCLRTSAPGSVSYTVGVRSPGRDGKFDTTSYPPGLFDPAQPDHDVVWIDGVFVTAPRPR